MKPPAPRLLLTGAKGLVGSALLKHWRTHAPDLQITTLTRHPQDPHDRPWHPEAPTLDPALLDHHDYVIHLAGEPIAQRWTAQTRARLRQSRIHTTAIMAEALARCAHPPSCFITASATGYYGPRVPVPLTESAPCGTGFLASLCQDWEAATAPAQAVGIRTLHARFGLLLSPSGGILARLLPLFTKGLGGPLGDGQHAMSWMSLDDATAALLHLALNTTLDGPVNFTSPQPVSNALFTQTLARTLGRPAPWRVPRSLLRLAWGDMADEALFADIQALPERLTRSGFAHRHPTLEEALKPLAKGR